MWSLLEFWGSEQLLKDDLCLTPLPPLGKQIVYLSFILQHLTLYPFQSRAECAGVLVKVLTRWSKGCNADHLIGTFILFYYLHLYFHRETHRILSPCRIGRGWTLMSLSILTSEFPHVFLAKTLQSRSVVASGLLLETMESYF